MTSSADKFASMIAGLQRSGLSVSEIAAEARLHRSHVYRLAAGEVPRPSYDTIERLQQLVTKSTGVTRKA